MIQFLPSPRGLFLPSRCSPTSIEAVTTTQLPPRTGSEPWSGNKINDFLLYLKQSTVPRTRTLSSFSFLGYQEFFSRYLHPPVGNKSHSSSRTSRASYCIGPSLCIAQGSTKKKRQVEGAAGCREPVLDDFIGSFSQFLESINC
jgi:hypothetical protein